MTKEKLAKLRGMGLVFDEVFDGVAELKERKRLANELAIVFDETQDSYQNLNQILYHTYISKNGVSLIDKYLKDDIVIARGSFEDKNTDINIYYEVNNKEDSFGSICYVRMNKNLKQSFGKSEFGTTAASLAEDIIRNEKEQKTKTYGYVVMDQELLEEAIKYELRHPNAAANFLVDLLVKFFKKLAQDTRDSLYTEKNWNPFLKDYDPLFGFAGYKNVFENWKAFKIKSRQRISKARYLGRFLYKYIPLVGELLQNIIESVVDIYKSIIDAIDSFMQKAENIFDQIAIINAGVCGIFNGIGEFVAGLFDLCALLVTITDKIERDKLVEKLENLYESFKKHPVEKIQKMLDDLINYLTKRYTNKSEFENAYHRGEDFVTLFFVVEGLLAVVKLLRAIPKGFEKLGAWVESNAKRLRGGIETIIKDEFIVLSKRIAEITKGKIAIQNTKVLEELFAAAENANKELKTITEKFAKETGGEAGFRPETNNRGLKSKERSLEKINSDYGGDVSKLLDIAGSKVVYKTIDEVYVALEKFFNKFEIIKFKDRIQNPLNGYRDILMNIKMKNGHIVEFRFHLKEMDNVARKIGHKLYEQERNLEVIMKNRNLTKIEKDLYKEVILKQNKLYEDAWQIIINK